MSRENIKDRTVPKIYPVAKPDQQSGHVLCGHLPMGINDLNIFGLKIFKKPIPGLVKAIGSKFRTQCVQKLKNRISL